MAIYLHHLNARLTCSAGPNETIQIKNTDAIVFIKNHKMIANQIYHSRDCNNSTVSNVSI